MTFSVLFCTAPKLCPQTPASTSPVAIDLQDAIRRARANSPQFQTAAVNASISREKVLQAKAGRLPTLDAFNQFIYTEGNGTPSGVFIANDGVHVYNEQAIVREDLFSIFRSGPVRQAEAARAVAIAQQEIAARGLVLTVAQHYYDLLAAQHKIESAREALGQAKSFVDITQKQEIAGFVSHVDVVKAQLQMEQRSRDVNISTLAAEQARLALAVLLFPNFEENFSVVDDLAAVSALPLFPEVRALAFQRNPEIRSAEASIREAHFGAAVARYGYLPSFDLAFYYGIDANQFAAEAGPTAGTRKSTLPSFAVPERQNLGYAGQVTLTVPVWNWGLTRSKVREAELQGQLAKVKLEAARRQLESNLRSDYKEAESYWNQLASLLRSRDLAAEDLHLTLLRYQAGDATALEVVTAEDSAASARSAYDDGLAHYHQALANLATLTGTL